MRRNLAIAVLATMLAACGGQAIHGTYMLQAQNVEESGGSCSGVGRFADLHDGTVVRVGDGANAIVGTGKLADDPTHSSNDGCQYTFEIAVSKAATYVIFVGDRDPLTITSDQLAAQGFKITLYSP